MSPDNLPTYIPLNEAATRYGVNVAMLRYAVESGIMQAVRTPEGRILVADDDVSVMEDVSVMVKTDPELKGNPIRVTAAAEKYEVSQANLSRWAKAGYLHVIERGPKVLILDESDVKLATDIFHQARHATGSFVRAGWILKRTLGQLQPG